MVNLKLMDLMAVLITESTYSPKTFSLSNSRVTNSFFKFKMQERKIYNFPVHLGYKWLGNIKSILRCKLLCEESYSNCLNSSLLLCSIKHKEQNRITAGKK